MSMFYKGNKPLGTIGKDSGGGHTILDSLKQALIQRIKLMFKGLRVYDDSSDGITVVDNTPYEIDFSVWNAKTPQEKAELKAQYPKIHIINVPEATGYIEADLLTKLWENSSPNASFVAQRVTLSSDDYDFLYYYFRESSTGSYKGVIVPKGKSAVLDLADIGNSGNTSRKRLASYVDSTHINFSTGYVGSSSSVGENASVVIPQAIYGFKSSISLKISAIASDVKATIDYSTEEHIIGKWIDGSDLYEKTIYFGELPNATGKTVAHNISNFRFSIETKGFAYVTASIPIPRSHPNSVYNIDVYADPTYVRITTGTNLTEYIAYVTLRYVKTL